MADDDDTVDGEEEVVVEEVPTVQDLINSEPDSVNEIVGVFQEAREAALNKTKLRARMIRMQDASTSSIARASITSATMAAYSVACAYTEED